MSETNKGQFGLQGSPDGITTERSEGVIPLDYAKSCHQKFKVLKLILQLYIKLLVAPVARHKK